MLDRDLRIDELATSILHAEHICSRDPFQPDPAGSAEQAKLLMQLFELDQAPVAGSGGHQIVRQADLGAADSGQPASAFAVDTPAENWIDHAASLHDALDELGKRSWLFVRANGSLLGTISMKDLGRPTISAYLFAVILGIERGLRRLYGSYEGRPIPDEPMGVSADQDTPDARSDTFNTTVKYVRGCKPLIEDLGFAGTKKAKRALFEIKELRDHLAHARTVLECGKDYGTVLQRIRHLESMASNVKRLLLSRESVWHAYANTEIVSADDQNLVFAGPGAKDLPIPPPVFVISAQNPYEQFLGETENSRRTKILSEYLKTDPAVTALEKVIGRSADPNALWEEESWAASGLSRVQALEVGRLFQQRAIFELTENEVKIISSDGQIVHVSPRNSN